MRTSKYAADVEFTLPLCKAPRTALPETRLRIAATSTLDAACINLNLAGNRAYLISSQGNLAGQSCSGVGELLMTSPIIHFLGCAPSERFPKHARVQGTEPHRVESCLEEHKPARLTCEMSYRAQAGFAQVRRRLQQSAIAPNHTSMIFSVTSVSEKKLLLPIASAMP